MRPPKPEQRLAPYCRVLPCTAATTRSGRTGKRVTEGRAAFWERGKSGAGEV